MGCALVVVPYFSLSLPLTSWPLRCQIKPSLWSIRIQPMRPRKWPRFLVAEPCDGCRISAGNNHTMRRSVFECNHHAFYGLGMCKAGAKRSCNTREACVVIWEEHSHDGFLNLMI